MTFIHVMWFRQDLRLRKNPAVVPGVILPIYIWDDTIHPQMGSASRIWLQQSLTSLNHELEGFLNFYCGKPHEIIENLFMRHPDVSHIHWNRCYEPHLRMQEQKVQEVCEKYHVHHQVFDGNTLWSPSQLLKANGQCYKVFSAFRNKTQTLPFPSQHASISQADVQWMRDEGNKTTLNDLNLCTKPHAWQAQIQKNWQMGEKAAGEKLTYFIANNLYEYAQQRDFPAQSHTSCLSPHLRFGEIAPSCIWHAMLAAGEMHLKLHSDVSKFLSELLWREFAYILLYHFPSIVNQSLKKSFQSFPWGYDKYKLHAWQKGQTGYPLIDAGMRQLWQTGYMHNRMRMVVASFLVKNLNIHWHYGRNWFWDCLFDADLANNSAGWQWVAGCGFDAAPYFRIFNPITQAEKFDGNGKYVRKFVPELCNLPLKYLFQPWCAPAHVLRDANVMLGQTYPFPIVDFAVSRQQALMSYAHVKHADAMMYVHQNSHDVLKT